MHYDKVGTVEEICTTFPGRWSGETAKALAEDIISFAGDSTVVEVSIDVGAYLCSTTGPKAEPIMDFSLVKHYEGSNDKYAKLYLGKIENTEIHLFTVDEFQLISPKLDETGFPILPVTIELVSVKAEERGLKTMMAIDENAMREHRNFYRQGDQVGKGFAHEMSVIREVVVTAEEKDLKINCNVKELQQDLKVLEMTQHTHGAPCKVLGRDDS